MICLAGLTYCLIIPAGAFALAMTGNIPGAIAYLYFRKNDIKDMVSSAEGIAGFVIEEWNKSVEERGQSGAFHYMVGNIILEIALFFVGGGEVKAAKTVREVEAAEVLTRFSRTSELIADLREYSRLVLGTPKGVEVSSFEVFRKFKNAERAAAAAAEAARVARIQELAYDPATRMIVSHEGEAAVQLENALGGKLKRMEVPSISNQPKTADFIFTDGPNASKTVDFMWTDTEKSAQINEFFLKNAERNQMRLLDHLDKADIVALDYRNLTPANQGLVDSWINTLTPEQQSRIIILR
jgi:hypothetical protein